MSGKRNISYVKPQDPSFLTKLKSQIGYKEGPTVDAKRQKLDCGRTDQDSSDGQSDHEEEKPQVVVLRSGDLTAEEVTQEEARIAREAVAVPADLSKPIIFQSKQAKDIKEARKISKKSAKKSEQLRNSKLSFNYDDQEDE